MDRWTVEHTEQDENSGRLLYALAGLILGGVALLALLLFTGNDAGDDRPGMQVSEQLAEALEQVVAARSPALAIDGRAQLLAQKHAAALELREWLGPMAEQEQALFALLNGYLDAGQGALHISDPEDLEIAAAFARLRLDYGLSVQLLRRAMQQNPADAARLGPVLADTLTEQGLVGGLAPPLREAVALYEDQLLPGAPDAMQRALLGNNMGIALQALGRIADDTIALEDAAMAFQAALNDMPADTPPGLRAASQTNLAAALYDLSVIEPSLPLLRAAEDALRAAIANGPRDEMPLYQRQLAAVLLRQADSSGAAIRLDEVGPLLKAAYAPGTPASTTSSRVTIYMHYGDALARLGETTGDGDVLMQAAGAYTQALSLVNERARPMIWAALQANLGTVHAGMAGLQSNPRAFDDASAAFKAALAVYAAENADLDWALTQNNLALTLESEAARIGDTNILNEAMRRYAAALEKLEGLDESLAVQVRYNLSMAEVRTVELQLRMSSGN